ncbi:hypothetical protein [Nocardia callitridis]|uniref:Uncharacterized protein n=1 Tax=Nocardia callitridis TaxID=648753 RepID=A0ABP9KT35_9NOCA
MDIHAYPTAATTPVDLAEAERIVTEHLSDPDETARGIIKRITEFDDCFTVVSIFPPVPDVDSSVPAVVVGGSVYVIDIASGAVSFWPTYPEPLVADQYVEFLQNGTLVIEDSWPSDDDPDDDSENDDLS